MREGEALKVLTGLHFPLAQEGHGGAESVGNKSENWRLEMVEILYKEGLEGAGVFQDPAPVYRAGRGR